MRFEETAPQTAQADREEAEAMLARVFPGAGEGRPLFSPLEMQVILIARGDSLASLEPPGAIGRLAAFLFGARAASRVLADPRLETLRRAVVVARHRHHLPDSLADALRRAGYSAAQVRSAEAFATASPEA